MIQVRITREAWEKVCRYLPTDSEGFMNGPERFGLRVVDGVVVPREPEKVWFDALANSVGSGRFGTCEDLDDIVRTVHCAMLSAAQKEQT